MTQSQEAIQNKEAIALRLEAIDCILKTWVGTTRGARDL